jgi:hypothetical protein
MRFYNRSVNRNKKNENKNKEMPHSKAKRRPRSSLTNINKIGNGQSCYHEEVEVCSNTETAQVSAHPLKGLRWTLAFCT